MQKDHKFFEDLARMASSAGGTFLEMKREMEGAIAAQIDKILRRMDLVTREDFDAVREMAIKARAEQEKLATRIAELEKLSGIAKKESGATSPASAGTGTASAKNRAKATAKTASKTTRNTGGTTQKPAAKTAKSHTKPTTNKTA